MSRGLCATLAAVVCSVALGGPAAADRAGPSAVPTLSVDGLDAVLTTGASLVADLTIANPSRVTEEGLRIVASLHRRVVGRLELADALERGRLGAVFSTSTTELEPLTAGTVRTVRLEVPVEELGLTDSDERHGVYPLRLQLQSDGEPIATTTTAVVYTPAVVAQPLRITTLVTFDAAPGLRPDGDYDGDLVAQLRPGARLDRLARELTAAAGRVGGAGLALAPSGFLLEQVADLEDGFDLVTPSGSAPVSARRRDARHAGAWLDRLEALSGRADVETVALPYGPADLVALVRGGLGGEAARLISHGSDVVAQHLGVTAVGDVTIPPDGLDAATLAAAVGAGAQAVVLRADEVDAGPAVPPRTPGAVRQLRPAAAAGLRALVPDPYVEAALTREEALGAAPLASQRLLAETAVAYFERPAAVAPRGLLLAPPADWDPPAGLLEATLVRLGQAPWLRPVSLSTLLTTVPPDPQPAELDYPSAARERELPPAYVAALAEARAALGPLGAVLPLDDPTPELFAEDLLVATAVHFRRGPHAAEGLLRIDRVRDTLAQLSAAVRIVETPPITLTSTVGQIPVTLINDAPVPLRVDVLVASNALQIDPNELQDDLVLEPGEPTTVTFTGRVLTPGAIQPLVITVTDPQRSQRLAAATIAVRSTAFSPVALTLTGGAAAFLIVWWAREILRRRRQERSDFERRAA